jgi:hypothetical protein
MWIKIPYGILPPGIIFILNIGNEGSLDPSAPYTNQQHSVFSHSQIF